jgi:hypothetical protein
MESTQGQDLLRPSAAVKRLYLSEEHGRLVTLALQELSGERFGVTEVLPAPRNIF